MLRLARAGALLARLRHLIRRRLRRSRNLAVLLVLALAMGITGGVFLTLAVYLLLAEAAEPWQAAALTALVAAAVAGTLAVAALRGAPARRRRHGMTEADSSDAAAALAAMIRETPARPSDLVVTGLLAGMAFGLATRGRNSGSAPAVDP